MNFTNGKPQILNKDQMARIAPAIFAQHAAPTTSARYAFVPTEQIVDDLAKFDFHPVKVLMKKSRKEENKGFGTHVIRFRHADMRETLVGDSFFELVLKTAHDSTSQVEFMSGLYRLMCSNGLCTPAGEFGSFKVRHTGYAAQNVRQGLDGILGSLPALKSAQTEMANTILAPEERVALAQSAAALRWGDESPLREASQLLTRRRAADNSSDLWSTFNVIQENLVRGGLLARGSSGMPYRTREMKNVGESVRLNRELWKLAETMGKIKRGETVELQAPAEEKSKENAPLE